MKLLDLIARNDAAWDNMDAAGREATRQMFINDGWRTCDHPSCPPWNCRITNPPDRSPQS